MTHRHLLLLLTLLGALLCPRTGWAADLVAQNDSVATEGEVRGLVTNVEGAQLGGVIVQAFRLPDSVLVGGCATDTLGRYFIKPLGVGDYVIKTNAMGYSQGKIKVSVTAEKMLCEATPIRIDVTDYTLSEAVVVGTIAAVTVDADTVSYNAAAYQTPEGAMVDELIQQIPGAEITDDGTIKINGKEYKKILIDGKEYFGDDPNATLKNLPANIIRRIKTYDRKSDFSRITGIDDGEENNVIDIEIKPNMFKGIVGSVGVSGGNHDRYSDHFNANKFRKQQHVAVVANINNVNNPAFSERGSGASNFSQNARAGLTASKSVGITMAKDKKDKYRISGNARYNYTNNEQQSERTTETIYSDSVKRLALNDSHSFRRRSEFNTNFEVEWKPDTLTTIQFRPNLSYSHTDNYSQSDGITNKLDTNVDSVLTAINDTHSHSTSSSDGLNTSASMNINRRLSRTGRNLSFSASFNYSDNTSESHSRNLSQYFLQPLRDRNYNRQSDTHNHSMRYSFGFSYSEPIFKGSFLQLRYNYNHSHQRGNRYGRELLYPIDSLSQEDPLIDWTNIPIDTILSNCNSNDYTAHTINASIRHVTNKLNINYGVQLNPRHNETNFIFGQKMSSGFVKQDLFNWSPSFRFRYRFTRRKTAEFTYNGQSGDPDINQLQEIIDKMNPQFIRYGNPELKPSFTHRFNANVNLYGDKSHRSLVTNWGYSTVTNSTSNMVLSESSTGLRVSKLMNVNGQQNINGNLNFNTPLDSMQRWNISTNTSGNYSQTENYVSTPLSDAKIKEAGVTTNFQDITFDDIDKLKQYARMNHTRTFQLRQNLTISYRTKGFFWRLGSGISYYKITNSLNTAKERETFDYTINTNGQVELPLNMQLSTNLNYHSRHGYSSNIEKNIVIWNAQLTKRMFKHNTGLLSLQVFDLLHQRSNVTRNFNTLSISDTRQEMLRNYFLLTFQYRINTMGRGLNRSNGFGNRQGQNKNGQNNGYNRQGNRSNQNIRNGNSSNNSGNRMGRSSFGRNR